MDGSCSLPREDRQHDMGLSRMHALGLPVPPAIVLSTHACHAYHASDADLKDPIVGGEHRLSLLEFNLSNSGKGQSAFAQMQMLSGSDPVCQTGSK
jgi:phosphoenolpyruvate synthase/pyruvate phosphate dikinase